MFKIKLNALGWIFTSAITILLCACAISIITFGIQGVRPELKPQKRENAPIASSHAALGETPNYGVFYTDTIVFLGDTTVSSMADENTLLNGEGTLQIWTDADGSLPLASNIDKTEIVIPSLDQNAYIADAIAEIRPQYLLITVGFENGVRYCTKAQFKDYYTKLIVTVKEASPETKIIVNSVFPVSKKYERKTSGISMEKIDTANGWIVEIAEEQGVRYLDSASALKSSKGYLKSEYDSGDGLHLNAEGYKAFLNYVRTHGYK